ncbi:winged helix-turn-helix domain-containing protein [Actinocrispum wychmicini]|uniref:Transcriptional regulator n=1 Tax=Actinocrispum wychmicini TaxID=1213861 RepID=A0A4R2JE27_9PSEU|nr:winged helix-turn-helix domain-containing protein [Actinocrispum wychmicini]TCO57224.1 transcriptional regulator [Actinocrispum wychmicini]
MPTAQLTVILQLTVEKDQAQTVADRLADALRDVPTVPAQRAVSPVKLLILPDSRRVLSDGSPVDLTRLEFDLLLYLCRHPGRVHRRSTLLAEVWGIAGELGSRTVDVHVRRLRGKLGFDPITTVRGVGYLVDPAAGFTVEST